MENKARFIQVYANLPINLRNEVVLVIDDKPITWNVAYIEVTNETEQGKRILQKLINLDII